MTKFLRPIMVTVSLAMFSMSTARAAEIKNVATVDMKKLFDEYYLTKSAQEQVKAEQAVIAKENNEKLKDINKIADEIKNLSKQIADPIVSQKQKDKLIRQRQLAANRGNALENNRREWLRRRNKAINENIVSEMRKILDQINAKVAEYARDNDVDMIFDKTSRGSTQTFFLCFSKDKFDVTATLLQTLNQQKGKDK